MPEKKEYLNAENAAVLKHVDMYQGIITRMAGNSSACKNWCIVLVSAFLAFAIKDEKIAYLWLGGLPILIFWFLDAYYLGLERQFRAAFNEDMKKLREDEFTKADLFKVRATGKLPNEIKEVWNSLSTTPVYAGLVILISMIALVDKIKHVF